MTLTARDVRKQREAEQRRKAIIKIVRKLIRKGGIGEISLRKVAEMAGYSTTVVYSLFEDKAMLITQAMDEDLLELTRVLDAAARCDDQGVLFVLIGDGMMRQHLQQRVSSEQLDNVVILPSIAKELARSYISAADLCLVTLLDIPLFHGAIPTKLLDYMACARPVLCGVAGEAGEIVERAGAGLVFKADCNDLLAAISELLDDQDKRRAFGEGGARYVREHFSADASRIRMEKVLVRAAAVTEPIG